MDMEEPNSPTTRLLTLLNVSAAKSNKRRRIYDEEHSLRKLNTRKPKSKISFAESEQTRVVIPDEEDTEVLETSRIEESAEGVDDGEESAEEDVPDIPGT